MHKHVVQAIGVTRRTVGNWCHGRTGPEPQYVGPLLVFLQGFEPSLTLDAILGEQPVSHVISPTA